MQSKIDYQNGLNKLIYGDNLTIMREMPNDFIDLIYLDPPFNSNRNYNLMYRTMTGMLVPEQEEAFCDAWTLSSEDIEKLKILPEILEQYEMDSEMIAFWENWMSALRNTNPKLLSYLFYMMQRLFEMRRILKPTGSIYLHCDPTASHYIKVTMDGIFGHKNFRNEIIWHYDGPQRPSKKNFGAKHDIILRFSNSSEYFSNPEGIAPPNILSSEELKKYKKTKTGTYFYDLPRGDYTDESIKKLDAENRIRWTKNNKPRVIYYLKRDSKGNTIRSKQLHDVWSDIISLGHAGGSEKLGYPTQKPIALLEQIIKASCPEDGIVFDPFCGCGTTIYSAHKTKRQWIGCDIAILSTKLVKDILEKGKPPLVNNPLELSKDFELCGYPMSVEGAQMLFEQDPRQFEHWAVEWVDGFVNKKQSGDKGIDGRIYFKSNDDKNLQIMILFVKGGKHINPAMVRELRGTMEREGAKLAGLLLTETPTRGMIEEANKAGQYSHNGTNYNRMQILTTKDMTEEKRLFHIPNKIGHKHKDRQERLSLS